MTTRSKRPRPARANARPAVTARPKSIADELGHEGGLEAGLSVTAEELGTTFLNDVTARDGLASVTEEVPELSLQGGTPTDAALTGPTVDPDKSIWEQTVAQTIQHSEDDVEQTRGSSGVRSPEVLDVPRPKSRRRHES